MGRAQAAGLAIPGLDPAKEPCMAPVAKATADVVASLLLLGAAQEATTVPVAEAKAIATVDAAAFPCP